MTRHFTTLIFLFMTVMTAGAQRTERSVVARADSIYHEALRSSGKDREVLALRSAALYENEVRSSGRWNGYLLYNLGTTYHLGGDLGRAILNYRRAQRLLPGFADLEANLGAALGQRVDQIEPGQREEILRALFFWHHIVDPATRRIAFIIAFTAIWMFLAWNTLRASSAARALAWSAAVISFILCISVGSDFMSDFRGNSGVIVAREVTARKGPGHGYAAAYEGGLHQGTEITILEQEGDWHRARLMDGAQCWLPEGSFETY